MERCVISEFKIDYQLVARPSLYGVILSCCGQQKGFQLYHHNGHIIKRFSKPRRPGRPIWCPNGILMLRNAPNLNWLLIMMLSHNYMIPKCSRIFNAFSRFLLHFFHEVMKSGFSRYAFCSTFSKGG